MKDQLLGCLFPEMLSKECGTAMVYCNDSSTVDNPTWCDSQDPIYFSWAALTNTYM